jgi:hypothetical protein
MRARFYQAQTGNFTSRDPAFLSTDTAFTYAGNDPVDGFDPLGLCTTQATGYYPGPCATTAAQVQKAAAYFQSHTGGGWSWSNAFKAEADFGVGIVNAAVSTVTLGAVRISSPYCGFGWASDVGGIYFNVSLAILSVGTADGAVVGNAAETEVATVIAGDEGSEGFTSFGAAKRALGSPGDGNVYDHVVEQSQIERSGFSPEQIHNPDNLNPVSADVNQLKANYYSTKQPFSQPGTVRDWLTGQSFEDQFSFGQNVTKQIENGEIP